MCYNVVMILILSLSTFALHTFIFQRLTALFFLFKYLTML